MKLFDNGKIPLGDFLEACQYRFHCNPTETPLITNERYDSLKTRCKTLTDGPPRKGVVFYPTYIRSLAFYLWMRREGRDEGDREATQKLIDQAKK